jgi:DNA recombination protein RmuC
MDSGLISSLLLLGTVLNLGLLIVVLVRASGSRTQADDVRNDLRLGRDEARCSAKESRDEMTAGIRAINESLRDQNTLQQNHFTGTATQLRELSESFRVATDGLRAMLDSRVKGLQEGNETKLEAIRNVLELIRDTVEKKLECAREEMAAGLQANSEVAVATLDRMMTTQMSQLDLMTKQLKELSETNHGTLDRIRTTFDSRIQDLQAANDRKFDEMHRGVSERLQLCTESLEKNVQSASASQQDRLELMTQQLKELSRENQSGLEKIRQSLDVSVKELRDSNEQKLEQMRQTVDEKLQDTLEKRLGESFRFVSERLELVHKGLGEMQSLATGVGDLKRVLTNVKTRGTWSEVQLGAILDEILTPDQWAKNVSVKEGSLERVEFAVRLPGPKDDPTRCVWLPIDSKFPKEDYMRLQSAAEAGDPSAVQTAADALLRALRIAAKDIHDKYVSPPSTTDYAVMFLATEGLYAEALRQPQFVEEMLQKYRVLIAGPTTLAAILCSLRMGFQTLMVEQRAAEVWRVLGAVKTEFGKFGGVLEKVQRQLHTAVRTIEETGTRTRAMERKLRSVEQLNPSETATILSLPGGIGNVGETDDDVGEMAGASSANDPMVGAASDLSPTGTDAN